VARAALPAFLLVSFPSDDARAQVERVRPTLVVSAGVVLAGRVASGAITETVPDLTRRSFDFTGRRVAGLELKARPVLGAEGWVPVGRRGWAAFASLARSAGRGKLSGREEASFGGQGLNVSETWFYYDQLVRWTGSAGVARVIPLAGAWFADLQLGGTVGRIRARGDGSCPPTPPSTGFVQPCLRNPNVSLVTPGARAGAALSTPAWRGVRARAQLAADVLLPDGTALLPDSPFAVGNVTRRQSSRRAHLLPSASLGLALAIPG
jgi:hypothetical protein